MLARSEVAIENAKSPNRVGSRERDPLIYELDGFPPVLQAIVAFDSWNGLNVLQHAPWLDRLLAASILRQAGITTAAHLAAVNLGLKSIPVDRRRHRDRETRLPAILSGITAGAD